MSWPFRPAPIIWMLVLATACATPASALATPASPTEMPDAPAAGRGASTITSTITQLTNVERAHSGLPALRTNGQLMQAAQLHADQMARLGCLEHVLSGGRYPRPEDRLAAAGYQWSAYAENIAMGQSTAAAAMDSWMHSSGHRANILKTTITEIGVGLARDSAGRPYYVQVFGRPQ